MIVTSLLTLILDSINQTEKEKEKRRLNKKARVQALHT